MRSVLCCVITIHIVQCVILVQLRILKLKKITDFSFYYSTDLIEFVSHYQTFEMRPYSSHSSTSRLLTISLSNLGLPNYPYIDLNPIVIQTCLTKRRMEIHQYLEKDSIRKSYSYQSELVLLHFSLLFLLSHRLCS